jgi:hypothetical protein
MTTILNNGQPVTTEAELNAALAEAGGEAAGSGAYKIDLGANISLTAAMAAIDLRSGVTLNIAGGGYALNGKGSQQGLVVTSGTVTVEDLTLEHMLAQGAAGVSGGGGGAGLGGGLFVGSAANVTLTGVAFAGDWAAGGNGAAGNGGGGGGGGGFGMGGGSGAKAASAAASAAMAAGAAGWAPAAAFSSRPAARSQSMASHRSGAAPSPAARALRGPETARPMARASSSKAAKP